MVTALGMRNVPDQDLGVAFAESEIQIRRDESIGCPVPMTRVG